VAEVSPGHAQAVVANLRQLLAAGSRAPATRDAYDRQQRAYTRWCEQAGYPGQAPEPYLVAAYLVHQVQAGRALSTVRVVRAALVQWDCALQAEGVLPSGGVGLRDHPLVGEAMKMAGRLAVPVVRQMLPVGVALLQAVLAALQRHQRSEFLRDTALLLLGWAGMFRCSELAAMRWESVWFEERGLRILVPFSKTDQAGAGQWVFIGASAALQPAAALQALGAFVGSASGPVFPSALGSEVAMAKQTVTLRLRQALLLAGVPRAQLPLCAAHSLRRGGATHAAQQGASLRHIMLHGRWKSDAVRRLPVHQLRGGI